MEHIDHLEFVNPPDNEDVHAGTFYYTSPAGNQVQAEFFVHCCSEGDSSIVGKDSDEDAYIRRYNREDSFNLQYAHEFDSLERMGCRDIKFKETCPSPFF